MPVCVRVSPSTLIVSLKVCLMRLVVPSLAYSTVSRYSFPLSALSAKKLETGLAKAAP